MKKKILPYLHKDSEYVKIWNHSWAKQWGDIEDFFFFGNEEDI